MATITPDVTGSPATTGAKIGSVRPIEIKWTTLTSTNADGGPVQMNIRAVDCVLQATGTFDSATLTVQGRNDGATWATVNDITGLPGTLTEAGFLALGFIPDEVRVLTAGGGGSQDIDVVMIVRGLN